MSDMSDFQSSKLLVRAFHEALDSAELDAIGSVMTRFCADDLLWRGFFPFGEIHGAEEVGQRFWHPLRSSLPRMNRRMDIFMAGGNRLEGKHGVWVCEMGHLMGLFDHPWLGIRPTRKIMFFRYCTFHRVESERIVETAMYFDVPHFARQAGIRLFPNPTGAPLDVHPGPSTHDGLLFDSQPPEEGDRTIAAIEAMLSDLGMWDSGLPLEEELARTWSDDMIWWGPEGIGSAFTIERYAKQHSAPFRSAFSNRSSVSHVCRIAEGNFGGFFGWPNFSATLTSEFMGMAPTGKHGEFRVIDIYRRQESKLAENWVFIDLLHFWNQQGVDFLQRIRGAAP